MGEKIEDGYDNNRRLPVCVLSESGDNAGGLKPEKVMADTLFKFAADFSLDFVSEKTQRRLKREEIKDAGI